MAILDDLASNFGLICINLRYTHIFLRLSSVLALLSFDCGFEYFGLCFRRKARSWGQLNQGSSKTSPIGPEQQSKASAATQTKLKTQCSRSDGSTAARGHHIRPVVFTMDRGEGHTVVLPGCTVVLPPYTHDSSFSCAAVRFSCGFSVWAFVLALKQGCIWPC